MVSCNICCLEVVSNVCQVRRVLGVICVMGPDPDTVIQYALGTDIEASREVSSFESIEFFFGIYFSIITWMEADGLLFTVPLHAIHQCIVHLCFRLSQIYDHYGAGRYFY